MIYIHVPFCASHCTYCAFYSELLRPGCAEGSDARYVDALCREIEAESAFPCGGTETLYFGGGTPSLLSVAQVERILEALRDSGLVSTPEEITFEVNPEDIVRKGPEYADGLRKAGINRISMGVQSFDDVILCRMGRRHRNAQSAEAYRILRGSGFDNISIDLIFGFAQELDMEKLRSDFLDFCGASLPQHVSFYQLAVEEGSGLEKMLDRGLWSLPDDNACSEYYADICSFMSSFGYEHYEISNWAMPSRRSRHNSGYWKHVPYLGLGPGAHSFSMGEKPVRRWNNPDLSAYLAAAQAGDFTPVRGQETLSPEQIRGESIFLGLRTSDGIPPELLGADKLSHERGDIVLCPDTGRMRIPEDKWFVSDNIIRNLI